jgi:hypothetical protein
MDPVYGYCWPWLLVGKQNILADQGRKWLALIAFQNPASS